MLRLHSFRYKRHARITLVGPAVDSASRWSDPRCTSNLFGTDAGWSLRSPASGLCACSQMSITAEDGCRSSIERGTRQRLLEVFCFLLYILNSCIPIRTILGCGGGETRKTCTGVKICDTRRQHWASMSMQFLKPSFLLPFLFLSRVHDYPLH